MIHMVIDNLPRNRALPVCRHIIRRVSQTVPAHIRSIGIIRVEAVEILGKAVEYVMSGGPEFDKIGGLVGGHPRIVYLGSLDRRGLNPALTRRRDGNDSEFARREVLYQSDTIYIRLHKALTYCVDGRRAIGVE